MHTQPVIGSSTEASVDYEGIANDVKVGSRILINDGEVELIVEKVSTDKIDTKVKTGGNISSHKGVNLPGQSLVYQLLLRKIKDIQFL